MFNIQLVNAIPWTILNYISSHGKSNYNVPTSIILYTLVDSVTRKLYCFYMGWCDGVYFVCVQKQCALLVFLYNYPFNENTRKFVYLRNEFTDL